MVEICTTLRSSKKIFVKQHEEESRCYTRLRKISNDNDNQVLLWLMNALAYLWQINLMNQSLLKEPTNSR